MTKSSKLTPIPFPPSPPIGLRVGSLHTYFSAKESLLFACGVFELQPLSHLCKLSFLGFFLVTRKTQKKAVPLCSLVFPCVPSSPFLGVVAKEREYGPFGAQYEHNRHATPLSFLIIIIIYGIIWGV
jgi:hypothetical protein